MATAYITASGQFLPGDPVPNERMADHIGLLPEAAERVGRTGAGMVAEAIRDTLSQAEIEGQAVGYLATATTQNDLMVPGLASQVHAALGLPPMEVASLQSVCASSMMALKSAWLQLRAGEHRAALVGGGEFASRYFRPGFYQGTATLTEGKPLPADAAFLRWTLSDGAAAVLLETRPAARGLSLRIDWLSLRSFADRFDPCMTAGAVDDGSGRLLPWSHHANIGAAAQAGAFQLRQDVAALHRMLPVWLSEFMRLVDEGKIDPQAVDWFCCHYSAHSLREEMIRLATRAGCMIPEERWFSNLSSKGNVGAASIFLILDDLIRSGSLREGHKVLLAVPESGQCIMAYAGLTVVGPEEKRE
jgi:3-oxoacyl-[acyl-carrier-protein] synthase-3